MTTTAGAEPTENAQTHLEVLRTSEREVTLRSDAGEREVVGVGGGGVALRSLDSAIGELEALLGRGGDDPQDFLGGDVVAVVRHRSEEHE